MDAQKERPQTDQQATNAALAALAAAGNTFALGQLWEINKGFLNRMFWQWYSKNKPVADAAGLTLEDFDQEAFFAVQRAAQHYDPAKGTFTNLLGYYVQSQINNVVCGEHCRAEITEDGRQVRKSANPLNECSSLDAPLDADDEGSSARGDIIEDPAASQAFQSAEDEIYHEELHDALEEALSKLADREADVLRRRYYEDKSLRGIGEEIGVHAERVRQIEAGAIQKLRKSPQLTRWRDEVISTRAWRRTGFGAWNHNGSVEERTVEYLDDWEAKNRAWAAERTQLIKEYYTDFEAAGYFDRHPEQRPNLEPRTSPEESTPPGGEV